MTTFGFTESIRSPVGSRLGLGFTSGSKCDGIIAFCVRWDIWCQPRQGEMVYSVGVLPFVNIVVGHFFLASLK